LKRAAHAEVQGQPAAPIKIRQEVLPVTLNFDEPGALEPRNECLDGKLTEDAHIAHDDLTYRLAQSALCE